MFVENQENFVITKLSMMEFGFASAETYRQFMGFEILKKLLKLHDPKLSELFGISSIPKDFNFQEDWIKSTGEFEVEAKVYLNGIRYKVLGRRVQDNVVSRGAVSEDVAYLVGGGVRVSLVKGRFLREEQDTPEGHANSFANMVQSGFLGGGGELIVDDVIPPNMNNGTEFILLIKILADLLDEARALAAAMVPKNLGLNLKAHLGELLKYQGRPDLLPQLDSFEIAGGAKADIIIGVPDQLNPLDEMKLIALALEACGYEWMKAGAIGPLLDRMAGDKNTTGSLNGKPVIEYLVNGIQRALRESGASNDEIIKSRATVTGKQDGGLEARKDATGLGGWESLKALAMIMSFVLVGKKVFFRGCGSASKRTIEEACRAGMIVTGIADIHSILHCPEGFTETDAQEMFEVSVNQRGNIADWARDQQAKGRNIRVYAEPKSHDQKERVTELADSVCRYWQDNLPDIIVEAATQSTLNEKTAEFVPRGVVILELANGATTPLAAEKLDDLEVLRIPGILSNAGGVFVSWLEWVQDILKVTFQTEEVEKQVAELMRQNIHKTIQIIKIARENGVSLNMEQAFYALAIAQGLTEKEKYRLKNLADPQDNIDVIAGELARQTLSGINPCGSENWNSAWDLPI